MVASNRTINQIVHILLKYMDKDKALRMARDMYQHVGGNKSVHETFHRVGLKLMEIQDEC